MARRPLAASCPKITRLVGVELGHLEQAHERLRPVKGARAYSRPGAAATRGAARHAQVQGLKLCLFQRDQTCGHRQGPEPPAPYLEHPPARREGGQLHPGRLPFMARTRVDGPAEGGDCAAGFWQRGEGSGDDRVEGRIRRQALDPRMQRRRRSASSRRSRRVRHEPDFLVVRVDERVLPSWIHEGERQSRKAGTRCPTSATVRPRMSRVDGEAVEQVMGDHLRRARRCPSGCTLAFQRASSSRRRSRRSAAPGARAMPSARRAFLELGTFIHAGNIKKLVLFAHEVQSLPHPQRGRAHRVALRDPGRSTTSPPAMSSSASSTPTSITRTRWRRPARARSCASTRWSGGIDLGGGGRILERCALQAGRRRADHRLGAVGDSGRRVRGIRPRPGRFGHSHADGPGCPYGDVARHGRIYRRSRHSSHGAQRPGAGRGPCRRHRAQRAASAASPSTCSPPAAMRCVAVTGKAQSEGLPYLARRREGAAARGARARFEADRGGEVCGRHRQRRRGHLHLAYAAPWISGAASPASALPAASELKMTVMPFILRGVNVLGINSSATPRDVRLKVWERIAGI